MTSSESPRTFYGMTIGIDPAMPNDTIAFRQTIDGETKITFLKLKPGEVVETKAGDTVDWKFTPRYSVAEHTNLCAEIPLPDFDIRAEHRARMHERFERDAWAAITGQTSTLAAEPPEPKKAETLLEELRALHAKIAAEAEERDAKLFEAFLLAGITIRCQGLIERQQVHGPILFVPKRQGKALERAQAKIAKEARHREKIRTFAWAYGARPYNSEFQS